jgi:preprotein translocase subunit SecD
MMAGILSYIKDRRIITLIVIVAILAGLDLYYGIHFGIEFVGGTQIPILLQSPANVTTMSALISSLQQRLSTFGLQQVTVEGVGTSELYVIVPKASQTQINTTLSLIQSQGRFDGIVNGREAVNGSSILRDSIGIVPTQVINGTAVWQVDFYITPQSERPFAAAVFGQGNMPLYMFLDRPLNSIVLINSSQLGTAGGASASADIKAIERSLLFGSQTIPVMVVGAENSSVATAKSFFTNNEGHYKTVFASDNINATLINYIKSLNYTVKLQSKANMTPVYFNPTTNQTAVSSWPLIGLLSAPLLSPSITNGNVSNSYQINGEAPPTLTGVAAAAYATNQSKTIASILSGGALPVAVIPGTPTVIPPTLGSRFLYVSGVAGLCAVVAVSLFIVLRYKKLFLVAPILITTVMELFIIVSVIGLIGTVDLAAVAGMIAVIGTGVDAQIIITDEIIAKKIDLSGSALLNRAFYIVWADAALLMVAMLPLFLSTSLVDVIGFSEATIFGALLSVLITRPAYGAIVSKRYSQ